MSAKYTSGNATVRSSAHRLRPSKTRDMMDKKQAPRVNNEKKLPDDLRKKAIHSYNINKYDLSGEVKRLLNKEYLREVLGYWSKSEEETNDSLEHFQVSQSALIKASSKAVQASLSDIVNEDEAFLNVFDNFVMFFVIPTLKKRLVENEVLSNDEEKMTFFYQRPPTLRIQPGPSTQLVPKHCDAEYGHQDGELNFWLPLTDPEMTKTDLHLESSPGKNDYLPLEVKFGEVASFHGSSLRHFVPPNKSNYTRVSLDFRVGLEGYFDPRWKMRGTLEDHTRKKVYL